MKVATEDSVNDPLEAGDDPVQGGTDARSARWIRRHMAGSVSVITTLDGSLFRGSTVSACIATSIDPFQLLISLEDDSQMATWIQSSGVFVYNQLPWSEQFLSDQFAGFTPLASSTFRGIPHNIGSTGVPILKSALAWVECRTVSSFQTGDHLCIVGQAIAAGNGEGPPGDPLIYFFNRYRRLC